MRLSSKTFVFYMGTILLSGMFLLLQVFVFTDSGLTLMQFAPGIVAIVMVKLVRKENESITLFKRCVQQKSDWLWVSLSAIVPAVMVWGCDVAYRVFTHQSFDSYSSSAVNWSPWYIFSVCLGCIGEEIGWRGYLLPLLSQKHGLLRSGMLVGLMWGIWHFQFGEGWGFILFIIMTVELSIIITWLWHKSNQSLLAAIIFHASFNYCTQYLYGNIFNIYLRLLQVLLFGMLAVIIGARISKAPNDEYT
ncbi:type II CAAX endopeptidase family protein [Sedimentibacter sp.]|uniref:CPBP family intramembrane glutamic endopeptidase n=1 Tax=Sedimentibacter sp. TaxID=1960295 RepID=UPI0028B0C5DC|nr:type II CAAX endopeptidase family protein [Sedimentibacter sp.]